MSRNVSFKKPVKSYLKLKDSSQLVENPFPVGLGDVAIEIDKMQIGCIGHEVVPVVPYSEEPSSDLGSLVTKIFGYVRLSDILEATKVAP